MPVYEDTAFLQSQGGTALLDKFTHCLLTKCSPEMLDALLTTIIGQLKATSANPEKSAEAKIVARRFVRSVIRVFVVFNVEMAPGQSKKKAHQPSAQPLQRCKRVFQAIINIAVEELCETANALLAPVRFGVARPTAPFNLSTTNTEALSIEELFSVEPMMKRSNQSSGNSGSDNSSGGQSSRSRSRSLTADNALMRSSRNRAGQASGTGGNGGQGSGSGAGGSVAVAGSGSVQESLESGGGGGIEFNDEADDNQDDGNDESMDQDNPNEEQIENPDAEDQQSEDMDLDLLAESESDSDGDGDGNDPNRSSDNVGGSQDQGQDGGNGGNEALFSDDDDSGESTHPEDDDSEAGETDEQDAEEMFGDEQLERRSTGASQGERSNLAPQSMQWAIRSRSKPRTGNGFIYIDPSSIRRSTTSGPTVASATMASEQVTMSTTASALARAFGIVIRQIADLLTMLQDYSSLVPALSKTLEISYQESISLQLMIEQQIKPNWDWLMTVMDSTEAQLRFGSALSNSSDPSHPSHPLHANSRSRSSAAVERSSYSTRSGGGLNPDSNGNRRDFLNYALSLMRAHNAEHSDSLPSLDVSAMKHIAYVFDALIYYMRSGTDSSEESPSAARDAYSLENTFLVSDMNYNDDDASNDGTQPPGGGPQNMDIEDDDTNQSTSIPMSNKGRKNPFFQRSDSTLCLGCPPPDPFTTPMNEALPLADQPQLLQPNARREDLFGIPKQPVDSSGQSAVSPGPPPMSVLPTRLGLSTRVTSDLAGPGPSASGPSEPFVALSTAPFQAGPSSEANFDRVLRQQQERSGNASPTAATCDTASVRSLDTSGMESGPQEMERDEPQVRTEGCF